MMTQIVLWKLTYPCSNQVTPSALCLCQYSKVHSEFNRDVCPQTKHTGVAVTLHARGFPGFPWFICTICDVRDLLGPSIEIGHTGSAKNNVMIRRRSNSDDICKTIHSCFENHQRLQVWSTYGSADRKYMYIYCIPLSSLEDNISDWLKKSAFLGFTPFFECMLAF